MKMGPLLTVKTVPVNVQVNIQENIVEVSLTTDMSVYYTDHTHTV